MGYLPNFDRVPHPLTDEQRSRGKFLVEKIEEHFAHFLNDNLNHVAKIYDSLSSVVHKEQWDYEERYGLSWGVASHEKAGYEIIRSKLDQKEFEDLLNIIKRINKTAIECLFEK